MESAGSTALQEGEEVIVCSDTIRNITSLTTASYAMIHTPDSFLLGECTSKKYGTIKADILSQFACPVNFSYPEGSEVDSVVLTMYYRSWYGDGEAPLGITAYEMDLQTFDYNTRYDSDIDPSEYCSMSPSTRVLEKSRILSAAHPTDSIYYAANQSYLYMVKCKMNADFTERFFAYRNFASQKDYQQQFKGLYITTDFGSSTALYVIDIALCVFYRYPYATPTGIDTIADVKYFYANSEVRQINRYESPDYLAVLERLTANPDTNYIIAPSSMCTMIKIPVKTIRDTMMAKVNQHGDKRPYVNLALLTVDVLNYRNVTAGISQQQEWAQPANTMMLIKEESAIQFFLDNKLPSDTCAICSDIITQMDTNNVYHNYYQFNMSGLFMQQLRDTSRQADTLSMVLIPVTLQYTMDNTGAAQTVSKVRLDQTLSATEIRSASCNDHPMNIELVYSGFSDVRIK